MSDNQGFTVNQDGSITIEQEGKKTKFVKESDLGAVKAALKEKETELATFQTNLANTNTKYDTEHQELLKERASKEELEKSAKEGVTLKTQVADLTKQMADLKGVSGSVETKLAERIRRQLAEGYKIDPEKIKGKALNDLENMEQTLSITGYKPAPANYDGSGGNRSASNLEGKSPLSLFTMGYEEKAKK